MRAMRATAALTLVGLTGSAAPSFAMSGLGCSDLPLYYRAVGKLINGGSACNITEAEARAVLARETGPTDATLQAAPAPGAPRQYRRRSAQ